MEKGIKDILSEYQYNNVGQYRAIADSLGYNTEAYKGNLRFTDGYDVFKTNPNEIRASIQENPQRQAESMERICKFFDKDRAQSLDYKEDLKKNKVDVVRWDVLRKEVNGDIKDKFTVIDHENKVCYTGKELYEYAFNKGYLLDGKGTQLEEGVLSEMTQVNGKPGKLRLSGNNVQIYYRKEKLTIPDKIYGKKLSKHQKQQLIKGNILVLPDKKGDIFLQVDRDLNQIVVLSEKELSIPSKIGEYELTTADKYLLANGLSLENILFHDEKEGYFLADVSMTPDKKGYVFGNPQMISDVKAQEILQQRKNEANIASEQEQRIDPEGRNLDTEFKEALSKDDYEKLSSLQQEGYKPSEEVIKGLSQDTIITSQQAVVIEKLFGIETPITGEVKQNNEEIKEELQLSKENSKTIPVDDREFKFAVENGDFTKLSQMQQQGYKPSAEVIQSLSGSVPDNSIIAVEKIFGLKKNGINPMNEIKLAHSQTDHTKEMARPAANVVNRAFTDL